MSSPDKPRFTLKNVRIENSHVGIRSSGPIDLDMKNVSMRNVETPFALAAGSDVKARKVEVADHAGVAPTPRARRSTPKSDGPALPVFCPSCKGVSPSARFNFVGGYFRNWGSTEPCRLCGENGAMLAEGVFDLTGEAVRIISAPDFTHATNAALLAILGAAESGRMTADEVIEATEKVSPDLAKTLRAFKKGFGTITFLLAVISTYCGWAAYQLAKEQTAIAREALQLQKADQVSFEDKVREANVLRTLLANQEALAEQTRRIEAGLATAPQKQARPEPSQ